MVLHYDQIVPTAPAHRSGPWHYPAYPGPGWSHDGSGGVL